MEFPVSATTSKYHLHAGCEACPGHRNEIKYCQRYKEEYYGNLLLLDGKTAPHTHAVVSKQIASTGCPTWHTEVKWFNDNCDLNADGSYESMKDGVPTLRFWSIWNFTSDNGSDIKAVRDHFMFLLAVIPWVLGFESPCLLHQVPMSRDRC